MNRITKLLRSHLIPFTHNRLLHAIMLAFVLFWGWMAVRPHDWKIWAVENSLLIAFVIVLIVMYRKFPLSNLSYLLIAFFLSMHAFASHYTYQETPVDEWIRQAFHVKRGLYDRIVHFAFGLMLAFPMREVVLYYMKLRKASLYIVTAAFITSASALYELLEMWSAYLFDKKMAARYIGLEGDPFDAQKDMTMTVIGVLLAIFLFWRLNRKLAKNAHH